MKRVLLVCALGALACAGAGHAATRTYSTGSIHRVIPAGGTVEQALAVPDAGPVTYVSAAVRIVAPDDGRLTLELVSPSGRAVTLSARHGAGGADYGTGGGCDQTTVFEDGRYNPPIARAKPPFVGEYGPFSPDGRLGALDGQEAHGRWALRVVDAGGKGAGAITCFQLTIARGIVEHASVRRGSVSAELSYKERNSSYSGIHLRIRRGGRTALDASLEQLNCGQCPSSGPNVLLSPHGALKVRDLDADGEPEVLLDLYTGGAHCCFYTLIFRYRPRLRDYGRLVAPWGDPGYRLADLDRDGRPELVTGDDRFAYRFSSFADSALPLRLWHYDHGALVDVTDRFPGLVADEASQLWHDYVGTRRRGDVRGLLAAYAADEYRLGRRDEAWARLERALARGELHPYGRNDADWPTDEAYLRELRTFLADAGYAA